MEYGKLCEDCEKYMENCLQILSFRNDYIAVFGDPRLFDNPSTYKYHQHKPIH